MLKVNLSQLLSKKSFIILYTLFYNKCKVNTTTLANSKVNAFALFNTKYTKKISKFLNTFVKTLKKLVFVKRYNKQIKKLITLILQIYLQVNKQQQYYMSFLVINLENYNVILSYKQLAYFNLQLNIQNQQLIQLTTLLLTPSFIKEITVNIISLL